MMSIKYKVVLILAGVWLALGVVNLLVEYKLVYPRFIALEREGAGKNLFRCVDAIRKNGEHLGKFCRDWASWDDTYDFIETRSENYQHVNLLLVTFENNTLHLMCFYDTRGRVVWGQAYDENFSRQVTIPALSGGNLPMSHPLFAYSSGGDPHAGPVGTGILMTENGPMIVAANPILTSENKGPVRGTLVMGRYLNAALVKDLADSVHVRFDVLPFTADAIPETAWAGEFAEDSGRSYRVSPFGAKHLINDLAAYAVINDMTGNPALVVRAMTRKAITAKGAAAVRYSVVSNFIGMTVMLLVVLFLLQRSVVGPISRLKKQVYTLGASIVPGARLPRQQQKDEIGSLGEAFGGLISQIDGKAEELARLNDELRQDIEKRKKAEEELGRAEARFRSYVENASDIIYTMNTNGEYTYLSPNMPDLLGYNNSDLLGKNFREFYHPEDIAPREAYIAKVLQGVRAQPSAHRVRGKDGQWVWYLSSLSTIRNRDGEIEFIGVAHGINEEIKMRDEREALQERLARSQKMEALGLLAGGVAHDLNNVLSGIVSYPELLLLDMPQDHPLRPPILTIQQSGRKAAEIVQDLLTLARRGVTNTEVLDLNQIVSDYLSSLEYRKLLTYHPGVTLKVALSPDLFHIRGGAIHLRKTIMNLVSNAAEAQSVNGLIEVSTENRYLDRTLKGYDAIQPGDYVVLRVADQGIGIGKEDLKRIFEPFYTKKIMGRSGTGLGMAVVWGVVQDHKGYIDIDSEPGKGTVIQLFFPVTREAIEPVSDAFDFDRYKGRGESILIVDDVEAQRDIASQIITKAGYRAASVSSGEAAVSYLSDLYSSGLYSSDLYSSGETVDLVVLDMIMDPGMDGLATFEKILALNPEQKVIIASGFSETDRVKEALRLGAMAYIRKPYSLEKILKALAEALRGDREPARQ